MKGSLASRLLCAVVALGLVAADTPDEMRDLEVESERSPTKLLETPLGVSVISGEEIQKADPAPSIESAFDLVPGTFSQGGTNYAQDARVSIRGFGGSAQFGIRGIHMYVDGVPSTLPDGQSEVDSLEMDFVDRMEVTRGPISSLYGGGGGGIVSVDTFAPTRDPFVRARMSWGSYHLGRTSLLTAGTIADTGYVFGISDTHVDGYRDHAKAEQWNLLTKLQRELADGTVLGLNFSNVSAPKGQEPGALNLAEENADRRQAQPTALSFNAREKLDQQKLAITARRPFGEGRQLRGILWGMQRDFTNALTFDRRVNLDRKAWGGSLVYDDATTFLHWTGGIDVDLQRDVRANFQNIGGARGAKTFEQSENVTAVGPWVQADLELEYGIGLSAGARWDWTQFDFGDRYVQTGDGDASDTKTFRDLSPRFGIHWKQSDALFAYANLDSGFQVPTTTELQSPEANGGFQADFNAEKTIGVEVGAKGLLWNRLFYDVAVFALRVRNVAVPYENEDGVTFWRDAGESHRRGFELALSAWLAEGLSVRGSYTYASYRYHDFDSVDLATGDVVSQDGNLEPNAPVNVAGLELRYQHPSGFFAISSLRYFSKLWVDDANTATAPAATTTDLRLGWELRRGDLIIEPFVGANNWTGTKFDDRIRPNASFGRYYEPAPRATVYGGIEMRFAGPLP
jgi:iron complex outermembrane receptor protein